MIRTHLNVYDKIGGKVVTNYVNQDVLETVTRHFRHPKINIYGCRVPVWSRQKFCEHVFHLSGIVR